MNDILKQRLIGALILLALGVVFWPIIFVQPEHKEATAPQSFPPPPAVSTEPIEPPEATGLRTSADIAAATLAETGDEATELDDSIPDTVPAPQVTPVQPPSGSSQGASQGTSPAVAQGTAQAASPTTRSEAPKPLATDANGVPQAWILQVATVSSAEKAEDLRKRLIAMQQKAYVATVSSGGNKLYRVCVGPKFERAELVAAQARINAEFGVNTMIVRYAP